MPGEPHVDFRRFTAPRRAGLHDVPMPRRQPYATRPDRWVTVELKAP